MIPFPLQKKVPHEHSYVQQLTVIIHPFIIMRFSVAVPVVLAASPSVVSAIGTLGFALGNRNPDYSCKSTQDYEKDFDALKGQTTLVRGYDPADCNFAQNIPPACKSKGFKVILGIW